MEAMKIGLVKIAEKSIEIVGDVTKEGPSQRHEVMEGGQIRFFCFCFWPVYLIKPAAHNNEILIPASITS